MKPAETQHEGGNPAPRSHPSCNQCGYFYITWQVKMPYGCRAMKFKSRRMPSLEVLEVDGAPCASFKQKALPLRSAKAKRSARAVLGANLSVEA